MEVFTYRSEPVYFFPYLNRGQSPIVIHDSVQYFVDHPCDGLGFFEDREISETYDQTLIGEPRELHPSSFYLLGSGSDDGSDDNLDISPMVQNSVFSMGSRCDLL